MTFRVSAKSSEQKPWNNLNIKILTPGKRRGLEHSSVLLYSMSPKSTTTEDKVSSMYQFVSFLLVSVVGSDEKILNQYYKLTFCVKM